jgi:hypothetical protein
MFNGGVQPATQLDVTGAKYARLGTELRLAKAMAE